MCVCMCISKRDTHETEIRHTGKLCVCVCVCVWAGEKQNHVLQSTS